MRLTLSGRDAVQGQLIQANESFYVFEDLQDEIVQVVARQDVQLMETNMGVDLFQVVRSGDAKQLTDRIELENGTDIPCIILDVSNEEVQYFTGNGMKRERLNADEIYMLHMQSGQVSVPFPMMAAVADTPML